MKKKLFALLLAVVLVVSIIPVAALATTEETAAPALTCIPDDVCVPDDACILGEDCIPDVGCFPELPCTHIWDAKYAEIAPTCEEIGWAYWYCDNCGIWLAWWPLCPTGHDWDDGAVTKEPTCLEDGEKTYTCQNDPSHTYTEVIPALGHDLVEHEAKAPTCTEIGWEAYETCKRCDYTTYKELPALGHTEEVIPAVAPTCTETGLTEGKKCSVCGEILVPQEAVPATGHDWDDGVITRQPTAEKEGEKTYTCQNDPSHKKYEAVPYVAPDKDLDEVPKTGDNSGLILATMTGIAMLSAVAYVFGKKRSVR